MDKNMSNTKKLEDRLIEMLKEDTGRHMLDSGGAYGRHWETNQSRDFKAERPATLEINKYSDAEGKQRIELAYTKSTFFFLMDNLRITKASEKLDKFYKKRYAKGENSHFEDMNDFKEYLEGIGATGYAGSGKPYIVNTYNSESVLDQVLQYLYFELGGASYVLLQIHNGCDVRGGYTAPRIFEAEEGIMFVEDGDIRLDHGDDLSTDDAGYRWYLNGCCNNKPEIDTVKGEPAKNPKRLKINGKIREVKY